MVTKILSILVSNGSYLYQFLSCDAAPTGKSAIPLTPFTNDIKRRKMVENKDKVWQVAVMFWMSIIVYWIV